MKTRTAAALLALTLAAVQPARAQIFRPETARGLALGAIAGAVIGNNSGDLGHNAWRGAALGAAVGGILGSTAADEHARRTQVPVAPFRPAAPARDPLGPVLLGGIAGAIIGNNSGGHNPWRGAVIGAGAGYVLGQLGEPERWRVSTPVYVAAPVVAPSPVVYAAPAAAPAPQSVTIINNYYGPVTVSPLGDANAMFGR
jgi:hypothetical protein